MVLRNVVPRQGTETIVSVVQHQLKPIEKCSSPTGDGNTLTIIFFNDSSFIEKCSSPTGDGNLVILYTYLLLPLRNVVPRQGTETDVFRF